MSVSLLLLFVTLLKLAFIFGIGMAVAGNSNDISVVWDGVGHNGILSFQGRDFTCSVGKNGVTKEKVEGDGCSPKGSFPLRRAFYRSDRIHLNETIPTYLQLEVTQSNYGWIDDVHSEKYNQFTLLPASESHEELYLTNSSAYDLMAVIGYNDDPAIAGLGSAIFSM
jgi:L,D-peptidoglycan transpeptidase YkuD (ErfK/YbiS/YcfS/YnhG family)